MRLQACWRGATLVRHTTADGLMGIFEYVPIGKRYVVDLSSVETLQAYNAEQRRTHVKDMIIAVGDGDDEAGAGWLPLELLKVDES